MTDDTTTWLKKNPSVNPLRRSLKTSLRFHVPPSDLNTSIMSNPDKVKDQGLFIPRMLQKSAMQMKKSRASEFKVPEMVVKQVSKKSTLAIEMQHRKIPTPNRTRKSLLPVSKANGQASIKAPPKSSLPRPSFFPGVSAKRTTAKRELIKKAVELSELKRREEAENHAKAAAEDSAVLRSILKKRASLRRASQIFTKKPKAKKVLFDGFGDSDDEKENDVDSESENDFNSALNEPTVFLNFPNGVTLNSPFEKENSTAAHTDVSAVMALWESYKEKLNDIRAERNTLEESLESLLQHSVKFQKEYKAYRESSEEMYEKLSRLGKEIEASLKKAQEVGSGAGTTEMVKMKRRSVEGRGSDKIKMSHKSKTIRKNSGRKSVPVMRELVRDMEDSFGALCRDNL